MTKKEPKKTAKQQVEELTADLQRVQAEFANFQRREAQAKQELLATAKQHVTEELLPFLDNLDLALAHAPADLAEHPWVSGVAQVKKQADEAFASLGIERIATVGQPFDHHLHEAVAVEGEGDGEIVSEELRAGYRVGDRVIRHAMVKVRKQ